MKIIIAGDLCHRYLSVELIVEKHFGETFSEVKPIIESANYSIVNFECPVVETPMVKPIPKCDPNRHCTNKVVEAIRYAGFKGVTLENNHVFDFGSEGLHTLSQPARLVALIWWAWAKTSTNHVDCESHRDRLLYALRLRL